MSLEKVQLIGHGLDEGGDVFPPGELVIDGDVKEFGGLNYLEGLGADGNLGR